MPGYALKALVAVELQLRSDCLFLPLHGQVGWCPTLDSPSAVFQFCKPRYCCGRGHGSWIDTAHLA